MRRHSPEPTPLTRIAPVAGFNRLYVKDESRHPTGTFKDRLCEKALAEAHREGLSIATISYGNTALSLAHYRRLYDDAVPVYALMPEEVPASWVLGPSTSGSFLKGDDLVRYLDSRITVLPFDPRAEILDDRRMAQIVEEHQGHPVRLLNITEGLAEPAYVDVIVESVRQLGRVPDVCIVPFGAGILCNEIMDYLAPYDCDVVPLSVERRDSLARMLYGPVWLDVEALTRTGRSLSRHASPDKTGAVREPYVVHRVGEDEVLLGVSRAVAANVSAEPSGAVGLGVLDRLHQLVDRPSLDSESLILVVNTGNAIDGFSRNIELSR